MNMCRFVGISNLCCLMNIRVLIAVLLLLVPILGLSYLRLWKEKIIFLLF